MRSFHRCFVALLMGSSLFGCGAAREPAQPASESPTVDSGRTPIVAPEPNATEKLTQADVASQGNSLEEASSEPLGPPPLPVRDNLLFSDARFVFTQGNVCQNVGGTTEVSCWDLETRERVFHREAGRSGGFSKLVSKSDGSLELLFANEGTVWIGRGTLATGIQQIFERQLFDESGLRYQIFETVGDLFTMVYYERTTKKGHALQVNIVDPEAPVRKIEYPEAIGGNIAVGDNLVFSEYRVSAPRNYQLVLKTFDGKVLWKKPFSGFLTNATIHDQDVYLEHDEALRRVDARSGRVLRQISMDNRLNGGHFWDGEHLYSSDEIGLRIFDANLQLVKSAPRLKNWYTHRSIQGAHLILWDSEEFRVFDKLTLQIVLERARRAEEMYGGVFSTGGRFGYVLVHSRGYAKADHEIVPILERPSEPIDLSRLPADALVTFDGERLKHGDPIPRGDQELAIIRPGKRTEWVTLRVEAGKRPVLAAPAPRIMPRPSASAGYHQSELPEPAEEMFRRRHRQYQLKGGVARRGMTDLRQVGTKVVSLLPDKLAVTDVTTGTTTHPISTDDLADAMLPGLAAELKADRLAKLEMLGTVPERDLVLLVSRGVHKHLVGAYSLASGRLEWSRETRERIEQPLVEHGSLLWGYSYYHLIGVDPWTGKEAVVYRTRAAGNRDIDEVVFDGDFAYVLAHEELFAVNLTDLSDAWVTKVNGRSQLGWDAHRERLLLLDGTRLLAFDRQGNRVATSGPLCKDAHLPQVLEHGLYLNCKYKPWAHKLDPLSLRSVWTSQKVAGTAHGNVQFFSERDAVGFDEGRAFIFSLETGRIISQDSEFPDYALFLVKTKKETCLVGPRWINCYEPGVNVAGFLSGGD